MMLKVSADSLLKYCTARGIDARLQTETGQVYVILQRNGWQFPLFFRILDQSELLQLIVFMPGKIKLGTHADLARLMHLMNRELDIPGFGMDENAGIAFYRLMLPILDCRVQEKLLDRCMASIEKICDAFAPSVVAVASGTVTFTEYLQKARELEKSVSSEKS